MTVFSCTCVRTWFFFYQQFLFYFPDAIQQHLGASAGCSHVPDPTAPQPRGHGVHAHGGAARHPGAAALGLSRCADRCCYSFQSAGRVGGCYQVGVDRSVIFLVWVLHIRPYSLVFRPAICPNIMKTVVDKRIIHTIQTQICFPILQDLCFAQSDLITLAESIIIIISLYYNRSLLSTNFSSCALLTLSLSQFYPGSTSGYILFIIPEVKESVYPQG